MPVPVVLNGSAMVQVEAEDPDGDPVAIRRQWLVNGHPIEGETGPSLVPRRLKRGDLLSVEVTPLDNLAAGTPYRTDPVPVGNTPPEVSKVVLDPSPVRVGDPLHAKAEGLDPDGDPIRYTFKWWRNNQPQLEGEEGTLQTAGFARGDTIVALATPHDAAGPGKSKYSGEITISNSPPTITSAPPTAINAGRYEYAVTAVDADGDPLTYALQTAPPGMTIDAVGGRIEWQITAQTTGAHRVRVGVEDGHEGRAFQEFDLTPTSPPPPRRGASGHPPG
ncbi:MAG: Ig-like domain-containing protein [Nitrospiraceae bacterium]